MKKLSVILLLLIASLLYFSCEKKEETQVVLGSLYGVVTDKATGEPIKNAGVELKPTGLRAVTGNDGNYEFVEVKQGTYNLYVSKVGYKDSITNNIRINGDGKDKKVDIQLEKLPPALTIVDDSGRAIDTLDFGSNEGIVSRSFNIFNNSDDVLIWYISDSDCEWIESINNTKGELKAGSTQAVVIKINRYKLEVGKNSTVIQIVSNNGLKQLTILASGQNIVETKEATDLLAFAAVLNAEIIRDMRPSIAEYGFLYSTLPAPSFHNNAQKISIVGSSKIGVYSIRIEDLELEQTYYFRAFVANETDTVYGDTKTFKTISHKPNFSLSLIKSTATTIDAKYSVSDTGIPLQEVGLCWKKDSLPTIENDHRMFGNEAKSYSSTIEQLLVNSKYYVCVYAINSEGTYYSSPQILATQNGKPHVGTNQDCTEGIDYLIVSGTATSDAGIAILHQGICYNTISDPTIEDNVKAASLESTTFSCLLDGLQQDTKYFYRAFATTQYGTEYGVVRFGITKYGPTTLNGYVKNQAGNPISNASVEGYSGVSGSTTTDANGYYELSLNIRSSDTYQFRAYKEGYQELIKSIDLTRGQTIQSDFILAPDGPDQPSGGSYVTLPDGSFIAQTVDLGSAQWYSANSLCSSSTLGGFSDWRLPTLSELKKMYTYRAQIGGFPTRAVNNNYYWSSTPGSRSGYYYYVNFNTGESGEMPRVNSFKVRAVRSN